MRRTLLPSSSAVSLAVVLGSLAVASTGLTACAGKQKVPTAPVNETGPDDPVPPEDTGAVPGVPPAGGEDGDLPGGPADDDGPAGPTARR